MTNNILEISQRTSKGGRVPIKIALLKIHENPTDTNKNGIHWEEEYVLNAMNSAKLMPICAEFVTDEKDVPLGHGLTSIEVNEHGVNEPQFLNSETVGVIETASIETIDENGESIKALCGSGYLYNQRYPNFVNWVRKNFASGTVDTSVEIMGLPENNNQIIYKEEKPTDDYRTPLAFLFSGTAILTLAPSDDSAIVLEVSQKKEQKKEEHSKMEFDMNELKAVIQSTISELNSNDKAYEDRIAELNATIESNASVLKEHEATIEAKNSEINTLTATVEQIQKALDDMKKEHETYWAEREVLEQELAKLKAEKRIAEMNQAISVYTEEEQKYAEIEINSFKEKPLEGNIDAITSKICVGIVSKQKESERISEINATQVVDTKVEDIFAEICSEVIKDDDTEDVNIF